MLVLIICNFLRTQSGSCVKMKIWYPWFPYQTQQTWLREKFSFWKIVMLNTNEGLEKKS